MAEPKVATVVITVDLKCCDSARKIKCAVCQLEMCYKINSIVFDENKSTVTVSGPFDPYCFVCKLRCMAGDVIKDVVIKSDPPPSGKPACGQCPASKPVCGRCPASKPVCGRCPAAFPSPMWSCWYQGGYGPWGWGNFPCGGSCGGSCGGPCGSYRCCTIVCCEYGPSCGCSKSSCK